MSFQSTDAPRVGIALSGGGCRAIAFHLGCLRTLHRLGVLERACVLSTVSGGSVIGAMYAVHEGTFDDFELWVRAVLETGFMVPAMRVAVTTTEGLKAAGSFLRIAMFANWMPPDRFVSRRLRRMFSSKVTVCEEPRMPRRTASTTTILRRTFDTTLFKSKTLGELKPDRPELVVVAAELRTGSAFYFTRHEAGSYRFGKTDPSRMSVSHAVAASAAYPMFLPALDEVIAFNRRDGSPVTDRVTLTDGGIYDNLGLSTLWPDRSNEVGIKIPHVDTIVACRAGYGLRMGGPSIFFGDRMFAAFATVHGRAQNASVTRLFDLKKAGCLRGFALPYLDQNDARLKYPPPDLVRREAVAGYPTNFSAMSPVWIEKLSKRGEQLTLAVIQESMPELLSGGSLGNPM